MGKGHSRRLIVQSSTPLSFDLPILGRKLPRAYEEWLALKRCGRLPRSERLVPGCELSVKLA